MLTQVASQFRQRAASSGAKSARPLEFVTYDDIGDQETEVAAGKLGRFNTDLGSFRYYNVYKNLW